MTALETSAARPQRRFTVEEYLRIVKTGILTDQDKVELIEGRIVEKTPRNPPHEASLQRVSSQLMKLVPAEWMVRAQATLRLGESAPEPDVSILRGPVDRYDKVHPQGADTLLVVEIADSTLQDDRHWMVRLYAGAGIPTYWIVNLVDRRVEVYSEPTGPDHFPAYRVRRDFQETATVAIAFPDGVTAELSVASMLPARN
jgi:Uma2 family endonuclease